MTPAKRSPDHSDLNLYRLIMESVPVGVITVDSELRITSFNPWAEKVSGYTSREAMGRFCGDVLHGGQCGLQCPLKQAFSLPNPLLRQESTIQRKTGEVIPVRMNTAALLDREGRLIGGVEAFQDISYLKSLEREREGFVSMIAHDMKSSLSIIGGFALRLTQKKDLIDSQKESKYLEIVKEEAAKLGTLVEDFLEFSRLQTGRLRLNPVSVSVPGLLLELYQAHRPMTDDLGLHLLLESHSDVPLIQADLHQLNRVFANLLDNAVKFSRKKGTITLSARKGRGEVVVTVQDEGTGISKEELPHIFEAFHRGKVGNSVKGFGLGLASVKAIVEAHGGRVQVESEPGKGSRFMVMLPVSGPKTSKD